MITDIQKPFFSIRKAKAVEQRYESDLIKISQEIGNIVKTNFDPDNINTTKHIINKLKEYSDKVKTWAKKASNKMIIPLNNQAEEEWKEHSKKMSFLMKQELKKTDVGKLLKEYMDDNVKLITSLPLDAAKRIHKIVQANLYEGRYRAKTIAREILKTEAVSKSLAMTIARTEVSRVATGLVKIRSEAVDINWFVWHSTHDISVRKSHKLMDKVLCEWKNPPSPEELAGEKKSYGKYLPGSIFNCRCRAAPLIRVDDVTWPAKVHIDGKIRLMQRDKFIKIKEGEYKKAA
jgi:hypothetical protein